MKVEGDASAVLTNQIRILSEVYVLGQEILDNSNHEDINFEFISELVTKRNGLFSKFEEIRQDSMLLLRQEITEKDDLAIQKLKDQVTLEAARVLKQNQNLQHTLEGFCALLVTKLAQVGQSLALEKLYHPSGQRKNNRSILDLKL